MFKKFVDWYARIYKEGKRRPNYHKDGRYEPPVLARLKATILILLSMFVGFFSFVTILGLVITMIGVWALGIFPILFFGFLIYFIALD